jgi:hypothetical protein
VQASASLRQIRPVSASRFRPGQRSSIGKVAEGVAIGAARICRGLNHLDRSGTVQDQGGLPVKFWQIDYSPPIGSLTHSFTWRCGARTNYSGH